MIVLNFFIQCLTYKGTINPLKSGYKEQYKRFSPGLILRKHSIEKAFKSNCNVYDLLGASDGYKLKMANDTDAIYQIYFFNNRMQSRLMKFILFDAKEMAERLGIKELLKNIFQKFKRNEVTKKNDC